MIGKFIRFMRGGCAVIGVLFFCFLFTPLVSGQYAQSPPPQILLTWRARSYVPSHYVGKALPGPSSVVTASVEVIDQGKISDLGQNPIYWYLDGDFMTGGPGKKTTNFRVPDIAPRAFQLKVSIPGYKGGTLMKTVVVQVAHPEAVIETPYPTRSLRGTTALVTGVPYFFNVIDPSALRFYWTVNGETAKDIKSREFSVSINSDAPPDSTLAIDLAVQDPNQELFSGRGNMVLRITP